MMQQMMLDMTTAITSTLQTSLSPLAQGQGQMLLMMQALGQELVTAQQQSLDAQAVARAASVPVPVGGPRTEGPMTVHLPLQDPAVEEAWRWEHAGDAEMI